MDGYLTRFYTCLPDRCYETVEGVVFSAKLSDTDVDNSEGVDCDETLTEKKKEVVFFCYMSTLSIYGHIMCGQSNDGRKQNVVLSKRMVYSLSFHVL